MTSRLPVTLPPLDDELLSSWPGRHVHFYGVTQLTMLHHCLPDAASLRSIDLAISKSYTTQIGELFAIGSKAVRNMSFVIVPQTLDGSSPKNPSNVALNATPLHPIVTSFEMRTVRMADQLSALRAPIPIFRKHSKGT